MSCAALARLRDDNGRYLLGLNQNRLAQGRRVYLPLGGALQYDDPRLPERFDAISEAPGSRDLRLLMPTARLAAFRDWFLARQERETSVFRELREELVDEFRALPSLAPEQVAIRFAATYESEGVTDRSSSPGSRTYYLHEIFDVDVPDADMRATLRRVTPESGLRWLTPDDLRRGRADDGVPVDGRALLAQAGG